MSDEMYPGQPEQRVVVIGGGISGLCTAYWLKRRGFEVTVLEQSGEPGGTMKSVLTGGWLIETGPNSALETTPLIEDILQELGILDQRRYAADSAGNRYILRDGKLHPLPMAPMAFLRSRLWSTAAKLRLLAEPFGGRAQREESIAEFVERRLGREFLDYAINPFVAGVFAGDPKRLSVRSAFPKLYALEEEYGGLIIGALRSARKRKRRKEIAKDRARLFSFDRGMQVFPQALAASLGSSVHYDATVQHIIPQRMGAYPVYTVSYRQGETTQNLESRYVVLSTPAGAAAEIIRRIDPATASTLDAIYYPPVAEIFLGFRAQDVGRPLDGFGFLVPEVERRKILGTIWSSALFEGRAPDGHVALTTFAGGSRQPELTMLDDARLLQAVQEELTPLMDLRGQPVISRIIRWSKAIPQYTMGYHAVISQLERFEKNFRGAYFCGNYRGGIAVGDCVMSAHDMAERIAVERERRKDKMTKQDKEKGRSKK